MAANVEANRHFAAGRVWARLFKPKPGTPQSVRLSDLLGFHAQEDVIFDFMTLLIHIVVKWFVFVYDVDRQEL